MEEEEAVYSLMGANEHDSHTTSCYWQTEEHIEEDTVQPLLYDTETEEVDEVDDSHAEDEILAAWTSKDTLLVDALLDEAWFAWIQSVKLLCDVL
jgi:uncharacterized membrane-anchored protein YjiN (DUF445 family)